MKKAIVLTLMCSLLLLGGCKPARIAVTSRQASSKTSSSQTASQAASSAASSAAASAVSSEADSLASGNETAFDSQASSSSGGTQSTPQAISLTLQRGINLSGPLEGTTAADYDSWIFNKSYCLKIKNKGFDHVRIPVNFSAFVYGAPDYSLDTEFMRQVDMAVNASLDAGLITILDFHGFGAMNGDAAGNKEEFYKIWQQIAARYQNYPSTLFFELLNEPSSNKSGTDPLTCGKLNEIQQHVISLIRQTNPTRKLVTTVFDKNGVWNIWNMQLPLDDKNLIVDIHNYSPMNFTSQGATWMGYPANVKVPFTDAARKEIESGLIQAQNYMQRTGRPVWLGEWGTYLNIANQSDVSAYVECFASECKKLGLPWCWWEFSSGYGAYDMKMDNWKDYVVKNMFN